MANRPVRQHLMAIAFAYDRDALVDGETPRRFKELLTAGADAHWARFDPKGARLTATSMGRWLNGKNVKSSNLAPLADVINVALDMSVKVTERDFTLEPESIIIKLGIDADAFQRWFETLPDPAHAPSAKKQGVLTSDEASVLERFGGAWMSYRNHTRDERVRRTITGIRRFDEGDGLELVMLGPSGKPWRGRLHLSPQTMTAQVLREDGGGTQANTLTLYRADGPDQYLYGLRGRVSDGDMPVIATYRTLLIRQMAFDDHVKKLGRTETDAMTAHCGEFPPDTPFMREIHALLNSKNPFSPTDGKPMTVPPSIIMYYLDLADVQKRLSALSDERLDVPV